MEEARIGLASGASQVVLVVKNPPANSGDMRLRFDSWVGKSPEVGNVNHSSILAWKIPWTKELVGSVHGTTESWT